MADRKGPLPNPSPLRTNEKLYRLARGDMVKIKIAQLYKERKEVSGSGDGRKNSDQADASDSDKDPDSPTSDKFFDSKIKRLSEKLHQALNFSSDDDGDSTKESGGTCETRRKITF